MELGTLRTCSLDSVARWAVCGDQPGEDIGLCLCHSPWKVKVHLQSSSERGPKWWSRHAIVGLSLGACTPSPPCVGQSCHQFAPETEDSLPITLQDLARYHHNHGLAGPAGWPPRSAAKAKNQTRAVFRGSHAVLRHIPHALTHTVASVLASPRALDPRCPYSTRSILSFELSEAQARRRRCR